MDYIVVDGVKPWDGRYELDLEGSEFTIREWGWLKRLTDYLPLTIEDGFKGGDPELFCALAVIAMARAGKMPAAEVSTVFERLSDAPFTTTIRFESDTTDETSEGDADPPESSNGNEPSSGDASPTSSEPSARAPAPTGTPVSATSASGQATSVR